MGNTTRPALNSDGSRSASSIPASPVTPQAPLISPAINMTLPQLSRQATPKGEESPSSHQTRFSKTHSAGGLHRDICDREVVSRSSHVSTPVAALAKNGACGFTEDDGENGERGQFLHKRRLKGFATMPSAALRADVANLRPGSSHGLLQMRPANPRGSEDQASVRLLMIRHAQSANKKRQSGKGASKDPELSDVGYAQAEALGRRLQQDFRPYLDRRGSLCVVSSPMQRCLLTIAPAVRLLSLGRETCICHGGAYEYGCAGRQFAGSTAGDIAYFFPQFRTTGFNDDGTWDYRGDNDKENEDECRARGARVKDWLFDKATDMLCTYADAEDDKVPVPTLVLVTHQTVADLLCHLFAVGSCEAWRYGLIKYKLTNAALTEVFLHPAEGRASLGVLNDDRHVLGMRCS